MGFEYDPTNPLNKDLWKGQAQKNVHVKDTLDAFGWEYDPTNPLNKDLWKGQAQKNVHAKDTLDAFGWEYDPTNPLNRELWKGQSQKNVLAKDTMEAFGWQYDPTNPLNKEEQKKAWQAQAHKNALIKKSANAFEIEKIELTKEEKKARWKADSTGLAAKALNALTITDKKKKTESEAEYIVNYMVRNDHSAGLTFGLSKDLEPLSNMNIVMDTAKAYCGILLIFV